MILAFDAGTTVFKGAIIDQQGSLITGDRIAYDRIAYDRIAYDRIAYDRIAYDRIAYDRIAGDRIAYDRIAYDRIAGERIAGERIAGDSLPGYAVPGSRTSPRLWIEALLSVSKKLMNDYRKSGKKSPISGVVISGNGPTIVPVDAGGNVQADALSWADESGGFLVKELASKLGKETDPSFYLAKIYLLQKNKPDIYEKTRWFLPCPEFLSFFLTGNPCAILPAPGFESVMWTADALEKAGLDNAKFPPFVTMGAEIGRVTGSAGNATGIPEGTPVYAGGPDFIMSLLGANTITPGRVCDRTGTSEGINLCSAIPVSDPQLFCLPHIREGFYNVSGILSTAGSASDWFLKTISGSRELYSDLYASLAALPAGSEKLFFLPQMNQVQSGPWPSYRKGVFAGLSSRHMKEHLFKAIIEGVGFAVREIVERLEEKTSAINTIYVSGIQATHEQWNRIRADILGKQILVPAITDTELAGCACVGLSASGYFNNVFEASESIVRIEKEYTPDREKQKVYDNLYGFYREIYISLDNTFRKLAEYNCDID